MMHHRRKYPWKKNKIRSEVNLAFFISNKKISTLYISYVFNLVIVPTQIMAFKSKINIFRFEKKLLRFVI
jgi:hypothetical protein